MHVPSTPYAHPLRHSLREGRLETVRRLRSERRIGQRPALAMTIYTASYEGQTLNAFLQALLDCGVRVLADVREAPISRKRGFSKSALSSALAPVGIGYVHIRPLGCPKPIRDAYRADGDWDSYTQAFLRHLEGQSAAVEELVEMASSRRTALLCYEADFNRCHRTYVARAVAARARAVVCHITADGLVKEAAGSAHGASSA